MPHFYCRRFSQAPATTRIAMRLPQRLPGEECPVKACVIMSSRLGFRRKCWLFQSRMLSGKSNFSRCRLSLFSASTSYCGEPSSRELSSALIRTRWTARRRNTVPPLGCASRCHPLLFRLPQRFRIQNCGKDSCAPQRIASHAVTARIPQSEFRNPKSNYAYFRI